MEFDRIRFFRPVYRVLLFVSALSLMTCTLQPLDRTLVRQEVSLEERIAQTLSRPVTRFPLRADPSPDYPEALYRHTRARTSLVKFYAKMTGSERVARAILDAAVEKGVDVNLAFALARAESDFRPSARSVNKDKSVDKGLFQLNSRSYPRLSDEEAYDPVVNARKGMAHLRFAMNYGGDEIRALAIYNAGLSRAERGAVPESTYEYIERVLTYRAEIESRFRSDLLPYWVPVSAPHYE